MARLLQRQGLGDKVQFIEVTMDPARNTPRRVRAYQQLFGVPSANWTFVTGATADLEPLWSYLGFARTKEPIDESHPPTDWMTGATRL